MKAIVRYRIQVSSRCDDWLFLFFFDFNSHWLFDFTLISFWFVNLVVLFDLLLDVIVLLLALFPLVFHDYDIVFGLLNVAVDFVYAT